jgi:hypothetical protein
MNPLLNACFDMNTVHNDAKNFVLTVSPLTNPFDEDVNDPIYKARLLDKREIARDQESDNPMGTGPNGLGYLFGVFTIELARLDASPDGSAKVIETLLAGFRLVVLRKLFRLNEGHDIVIGVVDAELYVGSQAAPETLQRVGRIVIERLHLPQQLGKRFFAQPLHNLGFVPKVQIDGPGGVLDLFGDLAHGNVFIALFDEEGACRIENLLSDACLLPCPPLLNTHGSLPKHRSL